MRFKPCIQRRLGLLIFGLAILMAASIAWSADRNGQFMVKGAGVSRCEQFTAAVTSRGPEFYVYAGWIDGYLSGMNRYENNVFDLVSWHSTEVLMAALSKVCSQDPQLGFHQAVNQLAHTLRRTAITDKDTLVTIKNDRHGVVVYEQIVKRVQHRLKQRGFDTVEVNGDYDADTRAAVLQFQANKGLEQTGIPDQLTLSSLLH